MKKILFSENSEKAESLILELEDQYLPEIRSLITGVKTLGIAEVSKKLVCNLINGSYDQLREMYWLVANKDIETFKSPAVREQTERTAGKMLEDFIKSVPGRFSVTITDGSGRNLNNLHFQELVEIDEAGTPFIPDLKKEEIKETFRVYLTNPKIVKVHEAQRQAAEALQNFLTALQDAKMDRFLLLKGPWLFLSASFETEVLKDDETITGFKIKTKQLNFELLHGDYNVYEKEETGKRFIDVPERRNIDVRANR